MRRCQSCVGFGASPYGRPRMTQELNELGVQVGQHRIARIMRDNGIQVLRSRKFKRTTDSDYSFNIAPKHLKQDFTATAPNQKWAGDIIYIWTREGWAYPLWLWLFTRHIGVADLANIPDLLVQWLLLGADTALHRCHYLCRYRSRCLRNAGP
ncbi:IS3 family transposase [Thioclava litoralis]|uniref:IS3 family transposase n=1 Tax=Thioclava litoralis TaxID=3076557 RepID=UPI003873566F